MAPGNAPSVRQTAHPLSNLFLGKELATRNPFKAEVVKMRYFIGLSQDEIARALGVSEPTVRRQWAIARAWLYAEMKGQLKK